tara:strand:+ start:75 stop:809 length:735 start_codon:yes stop_codon:yes gene_type:complete
MKILLVGPSSRVRNFDHNYFKKKKEENYKIVSYSASIKYFKEIDFKPDYFSFLDPYTIGQDIDLYEKGRFLNDVNLLIADLYENNFQKFFSCGLTCGKLLRDRNLVYRFQNLDFNKVFNNVYKYDLTSTIISNENLDYKYEFDKKAIFFSSYKKFNTDKFSCFLLPLVLHHFKNIDSITCVGFGDLDVERCFPDPLRPDKKMIGYEEFKHSFNLLWPIIKDYLKCNRIDIIFENENYFSKVFKL